MDCRGSLRFQYLSAIEHRQSGAGRDRGASFLSHNAERKITLKLLQIIVAYFIEASLLALTLIMFGIKFITDYVTHRRNKAQRDMLKAHEVAVLASTGGKAVFGVIFSCSRLLSESRDML